MGCTSSPVSGAAIHNAGRSSTLEPSDWKIRLMFAFWSANPIWMPKNPNEMFHSPASDCRGLSIVTALSMHAVSRLPKAYSEPAAAQSPRASGDGTAGFADHKLNRQQPVHGIVAFDRPEEGLDQGLGRRAGVL